MIDAGAVGYLSKEISDERLILAIRHAASGEMLFDENQIARANRWHEDIQKKWDYLTEREKQVLQMIADEKSEKEVATTLGICIKTVEYHMTKILEKLEVSSRRDARKWMSEYSNGDEERWK
jgi:NarL family two-component system response regulator LiaR